MEKTNVVAVTQENGVIRCDFESAKAYLRERLEEYRGVMFTEESKAEAKSTVANLRKEKKAFIDRVKEVKGEYMKPFEAFYAQAEVLIDMYDEPINYINQQVAEFEAKRVEEKKAYIKQLYAEYIGTDKLMAEYLPLAKIYNPKWENATTNRKAICAELMEHKEKAKQAISAITEMHSDVEDIALKMYKETFDLTKCILYINQHEKQKAEILAREQERIRREEEERIRREERAKIEAERRAQEEKEALLRQAEAEKQKAVEIAREETAREVIDGFIPSVEGASELYEYRIALTKDAKEKLEMYMDSVGIDWEMM